MDGTSGARALEECEPLDEVVVRHQLPPEIFFDDPAVLDHLQGFRRDDLADPHALILPDGDEHRETEERRRADEPCKERVVARGDRLRDALGYDEQEDQVKGRQLPELVPADDPHDKQEEEIDHRRPEGEFDERRLEDERFRHRA
ncbi:hypothetical protein MchiMG62_12280 [Methanoculleus chikugoensis]|uniref:Uncharacterized protein n=1 Tax=Methanoculleus chikugoensis TaxID=118126 RepID=A0ABM7H5J9_9EURY|nr:hypothetical protein MchiMG62_12280 [Methanoculleus chikugoensis]